MPSDSKISPLPQRSQGAISPNQPPDWAGRTPEIGHGTPPWLVPAQGTPSPTCGGHDDRAAA